MNDKTVLHEWLHEGLRSQYISTEMRKKKNARNEKKHCN